jgi:hypothetical protein
MSAKKTSKTKKPGALAEGSLVAKLEAFLTKRGKALRNDVSKLLYGKSRDPRVTTRVRHLNGWYKANRVARRVVLEGSGDDAMLVVQR